MKLLVLTILLFTISYSTYSQIEVRGVISDSSRVAIEYANIIILEDSENEKVITGTVSDVKGAFKLSLNKGTYLLKVSSLGYEDLWARLLVEKNKDVGVLSLKPEANALDEVVITAAKPTITREVDRLVFNIKNSIISDGNAWDALKKAPGVFASENGEVHINGKGGVLIMIDEKPNYFAPEEIKELLLSMSASEVESIEVISNPPSKFDAEGAGIINIKTDQNIKLGFKGTYGTTYKQAIFPKLMNSLRLSYKKKYFGLYSSFVTNNNKNNTQEENVISFPNSVWNEDVDRNVKQKSISPSLKLELYPSKNTLLSIDYNGRFPNNEFSSNSSTIIDNFDALNTSIRTTTVGESEAKSNSINLFIDQKLKNEKNISAGFNRTVYSNSREYNLSSNAFDNNNTFTNNIENSQQLSNQDIGISYGKIDYSQYLNNGVAIEFGAKITEIKTQNDLEFYNISGGTSTIDLNRTNAFDYTENVKALYANYKKDTEKISFQAGLRFEATKTEGLSINTNTTNKNKYDRFFPSLYFQYFKNEDTQYIISYNRRISRPQYWRLNPFRFYTNPFSYLEGNPSLNPSLINNLELVYSYKYKYFFTAFMQIHEDPFTQLAVQENDTNILKYIQQNLDTTYTYGLSVNTSQSLTNWWQIQADLNAYYQEDRFISPEENSNELIKNDALSLSARANNTFYLVSDKSLIGELLMSYNSPTVQGGFNIESFSQFSLGLKKKLWNKKASFSIYVEDIFNDNFFRMSSKYGDQNNTYVGVNENQNVSFSFRYMFGNEKVKKKNEYEKSEEIKRI